jgi:hypothetical protein
LSPKKERAAWLIAHGSTQAAASRDPRVDVTVQTMSHWGKDPDFQRRVELLRTDTSLSAEQILEQGVEDAAQTIVDIASGALVYEDKTELNARLKAALFIVGRYEKGKLPEKGPEKDMPPIPTDPKEVDELLQRGMPEED